MPKVKIYNLSIARKSERSIELSDRRVRCADGQREHLLLRGRGQSPTREPSRRRRPPATKDTLRGGQRDRASKLFQAKGNWPRPSGWRSGSPPIFVGGGMAHGAIAARLTATVRPARSGVGALKSALSAQASRKRDSMVVVDKFELGEIKKTRSPHQSARRTQGSRSTAAGRRSPPATTT